jgi:uncharacterized protein (DUF2237 family)
MSQTQRNVLGTTLRACCMQPITGFTRNGFCELYSEDYGRHTVCVMITDAFLAFTKSKGNDLSTPVPEYQFPGLKHGDKWCLCALRWKEAYDANAAPKIIISATHESVLEIIDLEILKHYAIDLS